MMKESEIMPFGKYRDSETKLGDVPASYLLWWHGEQDGSRYPELVEYIEHNKQHLLKEAKSEHYTSRR